MHYMTESDTKARDDIHVFIGLFSPVTWCLVFALYSGVSNHAYWASPQRTAMVIAVFVLGPYVLPWLLYFLQPLVLPFWLWWQAAVRLWHRWWVCEILYTYVLCTYVNIVFINGRLRERVEKNARWVLYALKHGKNHWIVEEELKDKAVDMQMLAIDAERKYHNRVQTHEKLCDEMVVLQSEKTALLDEIKWLKKDHEAKMQEQGKTHDAAVQTLCAKHEAEKRTLRTQYAKLDQTLQDERQRCSELEKKRPAVLEAKVAEVEAELTKTRAQIEQLKREMAKSNETIASLNKALEQRSDAPKKEDLPADMLQEQVQELQAELKQAEEKRGGFYLNNCAKQVLMKFIKTDLFKNFVDGRVRCMGLHEFIRKFIIVDYMRLNAADMNLFKITMESIDPSLVDYCIIEAFGKEPKTMLQTVIEELFRKKQPFNRKSLMKAFVKLHPDRAGAGNHFLVMVHHHLFKMCHEYQAKVWSQ